MNPRILLSLKFFLILSLVEDRPVLAATIGSGDCQPQRCGNQTIKYPFWLNNKQPAYCGVPPFNVTCISSGSQAETLSFNVFDGAYHVKNIFYENKSVQITAAVFDDDRCPLPTFNITTGLYPFVLSSANKRIFFLSNCSSSMNLPTFRNISCAADGGLVYFGGEYNSSGKLNLSGGVCTLFVVPVVGYIDVGINVNYSALLRTGWLLNWSAPDCTECSDSGGQCGFNDTTSKFMCFCPDRVHTRKCEIVLDVAAHSKRTKHIRIGVSVSAGFLALACAVGFLIYRYKKRKMNSTSSKFLTRNASSSHMNTEVGAHFQTHLFSYGELMAATDCFDTSRELGDGGFGTVYKGKLRDGRTVAVKRLYERNYKQVEQFMNEVEILSLLRHQNLVSLYGCTSHRSRELLLVYEFVPNGTVADHLHGSRANPEYHQCFQLTDKSDVYSFGVVLVELISSKQAIDITRQRSEIHLANMAITKIQKHELEDLVDPELWCPSDEVTKMTITMVAELAFRCLQSDGDMRPPIKEVLEGLRAIESKTYKTDEKAKNDVWTQDDATGVRNIAVFSPDCVTGKWVSQSTTPNTRGAAQTLKNSTKHGSGEPAKHEGSFYPRQRERESRAT
ncbi:hypothetical protein C4D60_Mb01t26050 [Musa balbisiana]|uniref:Protein kinase domain-containing protein n=1 Tax=Musa balbisiana TaxID=52838 RepID=A0A4S8JQT1_MUSBA|nr:hypothetical protein C4D60_Mb01t26050 [Musa balbisiana]